jgi:hypothetical protein
MSKAGMVLQEMRVVIPYAHEKARILPLDCDTSYSRGTCTLMFIAAIFTITKLWKQPRCPTTDEWIKKM